MLSREPLSSPPLKKMESIEFFNKFDTEETHVLQMQFSRFFIDSDFGGLRVRKVFSDIRERFKKINFLMKEYNEPNDFSKKKQILLEIQDQLKIIEDRCPPSYFALNLEYRNAHAKLFTEIKYQMASMGVQSLVREGVKKSPLSEIIVNMAPEKANELLGLLLRNRGTISEAIKNLYRPDENTQEALAFRVFLENHAIRYLGGVNSSNFQVTNLSDNSVVVLKVDNRLDMPRNIEAHLRSNLREHFSSIYADRLVAQGDESDPMNPLLARSLQVTDFYPDGSLDRERGARRGDDSELIISSAADKFQQMVRILLEIQEQKCMHPDAKNK